MKKKSRLFALERAYSLPPINLTPREAALLVVLGRFATETRLVPFTETLGSALDKVRGALTAAAQRELLAHAEVLSFAGVPQHQVKRAVGRAIEDAARSYRGRADRRSRLTILTEGCHSPGACSLSSPRDATGDRRERP